MYILWKSFFSNRRLISSANDWVMCPNRSISQTSAATKISNNSFCISKDNVGFKLFYITFSGFFFVFPHHVPNLAYHMLHNKGYVIRMQFRSIPVIPAPIFIGINPRENPVNMTQLLIQSIDFWIPAFAGMTRVFSTKNPLSRHAIDAEGMIVALKISHYAAHTRKCTA